MIVFPFPPNIPENLVEVGCILLKLDDLACNNIFKWLLSLHHILHAKWSDWQNTRQNSTKFSAMLGKMITEQFYTHILKIDKRLFPGSGETDCSARPLFVGCGLGRHNLTFMLKKVNVEVISGTTCMIFGNKLNLCQEYYKCQENHHARSDYFRFYTYCYSYHFALKSTGHMNVM